MIGEEGLFFVQDSEGLQCFLPEHQETYAHDSSILGFDHMWFMCREGRRSQNLRSGRTLAEQTPFLVL